MKRMLNRRLVLIGAAAALGVVAIGGTALAGHLTSGVKSYTGCLTSGGTLSLIKEGDAPQKTCTTGSTAAHVSGGDITRSPSRGAGSPAGATTAR